MNKEIFDDCLEHWKKASDGKPFWNDLALRWGYGAGQGEKLRQVFKYERKKLGITKDRNEIVQEKQFNVPVVGIVDVETLPMLVYSWGLYDQNIGINQVEKDACLLSWAGKILNDATIESDILTPKEALNRNAERIAKSCWNFLSKCDVVVGHNFVEFDRKKVNNEFLKYGLPPLKYLIVDTLKIARNNFRFASNKMEFINQQLGIRNKIQNEGVVLWRSCSDGNQESLDTMLAYNKGDILSNEELYYKFRPYITNFNVALYNETKETICPVCGSDNLKHEGYYMTPAGKWDSIRCHDCGCLSRAKYNYLSTDKKKSLLINSR